MLAYRLLVPALALAISAPAAAQNDVPAALRSLKPHQIVEAVMAESKTLGLTDVQLQWLDSLHLAIRKEPHRYEGPPPSTLQYRMRPMVSRSRAYDEALSVLTSEQRAQAQARFSDAGYRLPAALQRGQAAPQTAARDEAAGPLRHHTSGEKPTAQSAKPADAGKDPLQHRGGKAPTAVEGDSGKPTDPLTHQR